MKGLVFALDLKDDPGTIHDYVEWHRKVWSEISRGWPPVKFCRKTSI